MATGHLAHVGISNTQKYLIHNLYANHNLSNILNLFEKNGYIRSYKLISSSPSKGYYYSIELGYYNDSPLIKKILFFNSTINHKKKSVYYSCESLAVYTKNTPGLYIISNPYNGLLTHKNALTKGVGGTLVAYIE